MIFDLNDPTAQEVIRTYLRCARETGKSVGLTSGSFDLLHYHHMRYLTQCRRSCDILVVGVDSDELVRERKGEGRPIIYDTRRVAMVDAQKSVTFAFILGSVEDFAVAAELVRPHVIFKNDAFLGKEETILGREHARRIVIVRDVVDHASTGAIIAATKRQ